MNTGVGERKSYLLDPAERQRFNHRLVLNHRIAQGDAAPADVVRGAMLCLANQDLTRIPLRLPPTRDRV